MLYWIFVWVILALCGVSVGVAIYSKKVLLKTICIILAITPVVTFPIAANIEFRAAKEATVSNMQFEEVYKDENGYYYVRKNDETDLLRLKPSNIYKGDSNYVVKYSYPNTTDSYCFWIDCDKTEYDLVLTDLNVKDLPKLN